MVLGLVAPASRRLTLQARRQTARAVSRQWAGAGRQRAYNAPASGASSDPTPVKPRSQARVFLGYTIFGLAFAGIGFAAAMSQVVPILREVTGMRTDEESLRAYTPEDEQASAVNEFINQCPLAAEMRKRSEMKESRPHMKFSETFRKQNLTGGTLMGPGRLTVPPLAWNEEGGKSMVTILHLGTDLCGHPGIVHGGLLATLLDEGLARCCFDALPQKVAVTAKLEVNYLKPTRAGQYVVLRAETKRVEGRKAWVEGRIETLVSDGETPVVLASASGLFVSPKSNVASLLKAVA